MEKIFILILFFFSVGGNLSIRQIVYSPIYKDIYLSNTISTLSGYVNWKRVNPRDTLLLEYGRVPQKVADQSEWQEIAPLLGCFTAMEQR